MTEDDFWTELTMRINCHEQYSKYGWCDWFEPKKYILDGNSNRILGVVGYLTGKDSVQLKFTLHLPYDLTCLDEIKWERILPSVDKSNWITVDVAAGTIEIDPHNQKAKQIHDYWFSDLNNGSSEF